jgi:hypothetical protein
MGMPPMVVAGRPAHRTGSLLYRWAVTDDPQRSSTSVRPVRYKREPLDAERGPGLGCFWFQVAVLAVLVVLTPLTAWWGWPDWLSAALLFITIGLLLLVGQTIIFLLRLVAADRRTRRRPVASGTQTVGEIEQAAGQGKGSGPRPGNQIPPARGQETTGPPGSTPPDSSL